MAVLRWCFLGIHLLGVVVWIGGCIYQSLVLLPAAELAEGQGKKLLRAMNRRFLTVLWTGLILVFLTGVFLMLLHPEYHWLQWTDRGSVIMGLKHLTFCAMALYAIGYTRMLLYLNSPSVNGGYDDLVALYQKRLVQFERITAALGMCAILLSVALVT
jgi:uncharacterized membrane protein